MNVYVRVSKRADADLIELYKYLPYGLGRLFKSVLLDYFKYYTDKEYKFEMPNLKRSSKEPSTDAMIIRVQLPDEVQDIDKLPNGAKGPFIKNLTRMYMAQNLIKISRGLFGNPVGALTGKAKPVEKIVEKPVERPIEKPAKKPIFTPQEF